MIVNEGLSNLYGVWLLKRIIQKEIIDKIAQLNLSNNIREGSQVSVTINDNNELIINYD